jgi:UDP-N-acetyl-D-mannosaminuronate dehydrogenase
MLIERVPFELESISSEVGFRVLGFDIDAAKAAAIESGTSYLLHIPDCAVAAARGGDDRGLAAR